MYGAVVVLWGVVISENQPTGFLPTGLSFHFTVAVVISENQPSEFLLKALHRLVVWGGWHPMATRHTSFSNDYRGFWGIPLTRYSSEGIW